ncbi:MAG: hypothetical protein HYW06_09355 [Gemmatimonadetes bacterium]|nr:hypothetical protein [Gemmatimonadota bacterium]
MGCGGLLDVSNPNNIKGEDVELPAAGTALANGALARVAFGVNGSALPYHTATDELEWSGSRDGWRELDQGKLSNAFNEFIDGAVNSGFPRMAEGRWLADEAIRVLEKQAQASPPTIVNIVDLARAYLYAAIAYVHIANVFDDFALSDRAEPAPPVGRPGMGSFYDTAIDYLTKGLAIASGRDASLAHTIRAMRARANFDRAIWELISPPPKGGAGLVNAASSYVTNAVADAQAALGTAPSPDWRFQFLWSSATGSNQHGAEIVSRQEMRLGPTYVEPSPTSPTWLNNVVLMDPIDNEPSPIVDAIQKEFRAGGFFPPYTVVSTRELHLILAEAALAAGDMPGFEDAINDLRDLDGLTDWNRSAPQAPALDLLIHSRQSNLFLQTRRLSDHYRFGVPSREWLSGSQALTRPGTLLPISATECLANPHIGAANCST